MNSMGGIEALEELENKVKNQREDILEIIRQNRTYQEKEFKAILQESETCLKSTIESLRQNMFDIFNETGMTQKSFKSKTQKNYEFDALSLDMEKIKQ